MPVASSKVVATVPPFTATGRASLRAPFRCVSHAATWTIFTGNYSQKTCTVKAVLVFQPAANGKQFMAVFPATGSFDDIHGRLLQDGIAFHT